MLLHPRTPRAAQTLHINVHPLRDGAASPRRPFLAEPLPSLASDVARHATKHRSKYRQRDRESHEDLRRQMRPSLYLDLPNLNLNLNLDPKLNTLLYRASSHLARTSPNGPASCPANHLASYPAGNSADCPAGHVASHHQSDGAGGHENRGPGSTARHALIRVQNRRAGCGPNGPENRGRSRPQSSFAHGTGNHPPNRSRGDPLCHAQNDPNRLSFLVLSLV